MSTVTISPNKPAKKQAAKIESSVKVEQVKKAPKAKAPKPVQAHSYQQQLEDNRKYKALLSEECRKLGYALSLMVKFRAAFSPVVVNYIEAVQKDNVLYKALELNCARTKSGNFSVWLIQSYIRKVSNA